MNIRAPQAGLRRRGRPRLQRIHVQPTSDSAPSMGDQKRCRRETFDVADVRRSGRLVDQLEPFTCSADLQAVERPPPRRACSKSARMMTSPLRHGHVTGDANHTSTAKRVTPPRPEMWSARCFTAAVAEGSGLAPDRNGNQGRSMIFRHDRQARRVTLRRFAARDRTVIDIRLSTSSMPRGTRGLPHGAYSGPVDPGALLPGTPSRRE